MLKNSGDAQASGIVARGRTVLMPDLTKPLRTIGYDMATQKPITAAVFRELLPGDEFVGEPGEVERLRALGVLHDPDAFADADAAAMALPH